MRVLVADDSPVARGLIREILEGDGSICVVGEAKNGREAVELCRELKPDIVTMDLRMPVMDGIDAIGEIMAYNPVPILVVSSAADASEAYEAIQRGALETVDKERITAADGAEFATKVKTLSTIRVITHIRPGNRGEAPRRDAVEGEKAAPSFAPASSPQVFAIASSTGGPQALALILGALPARFPCPILVAQHMTYGFAPGLAKWLASISELPVRIAAEGEPLEAGRVFLSPSERNLSVSASRRVVLAEPGEHQVFHPTCDVLLSSVAEVYGRSGVGVILTGMGTDGASGIRRLREAGGHTMAQDEASSIVFGMNKTAIDMGAVRQVLPVERIAAEMCRLCALPPAEARR